MSAHSFGWLLALWIALAVRGGAVAQDPAADTESEPASETTYHDLRRSKDRTTQRFAERYSYLVRTQDWTSASGKSKVTARYVSHTPDLKQVTLAVARGSGANRAVREVTVQVDQLNKTCQSRVRQIDTLKKKLDELAAKADEDENELGSEGSGYAGEYGRPMLDERGDEPVQTEEPPPAEPEALERGGDEYGRYRAYGSAVPGPEATPATPPAGSSDPDPLGFGEVANETPQSAVSNAPGSPDASSSFLGLFGGGREASGTIQAPATRESGPIDPSEWRTSYAAFHANFSVSRGRAGEPILDWGQLSELKAKHESLQSNEQQAINNRYGRPAEGGSSLGEVTWEAIFVGLQQQPETGEHDVQFEVPPLPEPLKVRFVLAPSDSVDAWSALRPGQPVKFVGRLDIEQPGEILVHVQMAP